MLMRRLDEASPEWGPRRLVHEASRAGVVPVPSRSGIYRALKRMRPLLDARCRGGLKSAHPLSRCANQRLAFAVVTSWSTQRSRSRSRSLGRSLRRSRTSSSHQG